MRNRIYTIYALLVAGLIICVAAENVFAGGTEMPGDWGSGQVDGGSGSGGGAHATKWMKHYRATNDNGTMYTSSEPMPIVPQYRGTLDHDGYYNGNPVYYPEPTEPPYILAECHNSNSSADGVWILGNVTSGKTPFNNYLYYTYDTIGGNLNLNDIWSAFATPKPVEGESRSHQTAYLDGNGHYGIYRTGSSGEMQYNTISSQNIALSSISWGGTSSVSTMYYGTKSGDNYIDTPAYTTTSTSIAGSVEDIVNEYINYMVNSGKYSEEDIKTAKEYTDYGKAYNELIQSKGIYAFCSYPEATDTSLQANVSLTVDGTPIESGWDTSNVSTSITVHSSPISASTDFDFKRGVESPNMTFDASIVRLNEESYDTSLTMASSELNNKEYKEKNISLSVGTNLVCSSVKHPEKISGGDNSSRSKNKEAKACVTVVYEPAVAEIDSKTTLYVGPTATESGWDSFATYSLGEVNYGANAINATWSYTLSSSKRCFEGDFKNGACSENETSITSSFKVPFNRVGDVDNNSGDSTLSSPGYSAAPEASTKSYDLLPGEPLKQKQGISHKSGVRMNGDNASGSKDEESSVAFTVTAKNAVCNINGLEFGLNSPYNYGRMTIYKNGMPYNYGNGKNEDGNATWETHGPLFFKPEDRLKISYDACLGQQIKADKDSGRSWDTEWINNNAKLTVGITGSLLDLKHFAITGNAVSTDSAGGKNILAYEVLGKKISSHVGKNYQFKDVGSNEAEIGNLDESSYRYLNLGRSIASDFSDLTGCPEGGSSCKAHAVLNIPYNYILEPKINPGSKGVITVGDSNTFTLSISNHDTRVNKQVQDTAYHTNVKPGTRASYLVFAASTASTTEGLLQSLDGKFVYGDKTGDIQSALSGLDIQNAESGSIGLNADGSANKAVKVNSDKAIEGYNKICAAVAVYPADSHNMQGEKDIDNDSQYDALTDNFGAAYTRISVSCKTVGKYPTASVEGSGIATSEEVKGSYTTYNGRNFGSWSEYGLVANSVTDFASGASVAYAISNPQTTPNRESDPNSAGLKDGDLDSLQTHGNLDKDNVGLQDASESSVYYSQARIFVDAVKSSFFAEEATNVFNLEQVNDSNIYVNKNHDKNISIGEAEAQKINNDVPSGSIVIIYTSGNISISNKIEKLNATLIAEDTIDTCAENGQGGDNGQLLDDCYNQLVVNGVVYSGNAIKLDRVYGGGSTSGMNLDAQTLVQRAEVFNYNPDYIKSIYQYTLKAQPLTTTYIEELSTRY